jgi:hypothetical protein
LGEITVCSRSFMQAPAAFEITRAFQAESLSLAEHELNGIILRRKTEETPGIHRITRFKRNTKAIQFKTKRKISQTPIR